MSGTHPKHQAESHYVLLLSGVHLSNNMFQFTLLLDSLGFIKVVLQRKKHPLNHSIQLSSEPRNSIT